MWDSGRGAPCNECLGSKHLDDTQTSRMIHSIIRSLVEYTVEMRPDGPTLLQRLLRALMIVSISGILWFVYGIFVAVPVLLFQIGLFGATPADLAFVCLMIGVIVGVFNGGRNALDYWRHYDRD